MTYVICQQCATANSVIDIRQPLIVCRRCQFQICGLRGKSIPRTAAFSFTALIFYFPANIFPFMTMEIYGNRNSATIWDGIVSLANAGSWTVAIIVFLASILIPFLKLVVLFYLSFSAQTGAHSYMKTLLYNIIDYLGRWSMLDIFLLAVLVALMKLGTWTSVKPEIGSLMFALVVVFTMLASASFDTRLLWKNNDGIN